MKFSVSPVVRIAVQPKKPADLPKLVSALALLSKSDPCLKVFNDPTTGENIVAGAGELHLETSLNDLREFLGESVEIVTSKPVVGFAETVSEKGPTCLAKSPNKHNRLYVYAEPLEKGIAEDIEKGDIQATSDPKSRARFLSENYKWDSDTAKRIWCFGPNSNGPNILVDTTHGIQYLNEIKDSVIAGFNWSAGEGAICGEPLRGVKICIEDVKIHSDSAHRRGGVIIPTARRSCLAAQMTSRPRLMEPIYLVEMQATQDVLGKIYSLLAKKRGYVISEEPKSGTPLSILKAHLPVLESFGFTSELRAATSGKAFPQMLFDHWRVIDSDPYEPGTFANQVALEVRKRKKMSPDFPPLDSFLDTL
jgi:elongation factor 2